MNRDFATCIIKPQYHAYGNLMSEICNIIRDYITVKNIKNNNDEANSLSYKNSIFPINLFSFSLLPEFAIRFIKLESLFDCLLYIKWYDKNDSLDKINSIKLDTTGDPFIIELDKRRIKVELGNEEYIGAYIQSADTKSSKVQFLFKVIKDIFDSIYKRTFNEDSPISNIITNDFTVKKIDNSYHFILTDFYDIPYVYFYINFDFNVYEFLDITSYYENIHYNKINALFTSLIVNKAKYEKNNDDIDLCKLNYEELTEFCKSDKSNLKPDNMLLNSLMVFKKKD